MDDLVRQLALIVRGMWNRRWAGLVAAWIAALVGVVVMLRIPDRYEASSRIFVDTQSVLKPLMSGIAVQPDVSEQLTMLARTLITRPNIEELIRRADLSILIKAEKDRERLIDELSKEIKLQSSGRENLFNVTYRDTDKRRAQQVVQGLTSMFVESGQGGKRRDSEAARRFIDDQIKSYEKKLEEAESRLKDFKLRNLSYTTGSGQDYFARVTSVTEELSKARLELRAAEQSRDALKRELIGEEPLLSPDLSIPMPAATPELDARIEIARKQLDDLLRRYTDEHPDVLGTRRLISQLEEQRQQEIDARKRVAAAKKTNTTATNPVFQQIKISVAEAEANVASLRARVGELQSREAQLRSSAVRVPQLEAELAQMNRDYEILRKNYDGLVARRESASISEDVDASTQLAEFRIIDPPRVSPKAVFPNRAALAPLVLLGALAIGTLVSYALSQLFPTIMNTRTLREIGQRPVLGSVSMRPDAAMIKRGRLSKLAFGGGLSLLLVVYGSWIAWITILAGA
jgi:polysaccharide chain length determinant protein (PEP-CTERM system associated)